MSKTLEQIFADNGITLESVFVPPTKKEKRDNLQYRVTFWKGNMLVFETSYSMGSGHIPQDMQKRAKAIGIPTSEICKNNGLRGHGQITPETEDILYCIFRDAQSYEYTPSCDAFIEEFGYVGGVAEYRKGESVFHACLDAYNFLKKHLSHDSYVACEELVSDM